jgi:hypothetical protein
MGKAGMKKIWPLLLGLLLVSCSQAGRESTAPTAPPAPAAVEPTQAAEPAEAAPTEPDAPATAEKTEPTGTRPISAGPVGESDVGVASLSELNLPPIANPDLDHAKLLDYLLLEEGADDEILAQIRESRDARFVAGLIEVMRWRFDIWDELGATLNHLTNQQVNPDWHDWVEWAGKYPELESFAGFVAWKAKLLTYIDSNFSRFVYEGMNVAPGSRVEEIVWGGVAVDGIPALDNPVMIEPAEAAYLIPEERVFGVSLNGDTRAYPARFLDWHEMFNDIVGGEPVSLAY